MLMMMADRGDLVLEEINTFQNLYADRWVFLDVLIFFGNQPPMFLKDFVLDTDLPYVVKECSIFQTFNLILVKAEMIGNFNAHPSDPIGMAPGDGIFRIDRLC